MLHSFRFLFRRLCDTEYDIRTVARTNDGKMQQLRKTEFWGGGEAGQPSSFTLLSVKYEFSGHNIESSTQINVFCFCFSCVRG